MNLLMNRMMQLEFQKQPKRWQGILVSFNLLTAFLVSFILPQMPENIFAFLARFFKMNNQTEMILLNDYLGLYVVVFWVAFFEYLRIFVIPAEEGYLQILLSKPLTKRQYLLNTLIPALSSALGWGLFLMAGTGLGIALINGLNDFKLGNYLAISGICVALGLLMGLLSLFLLLWFKDTYNAILIGFAIWLIPILPSALFMYRPDVFVAKPWLSWLLVFPANLIWLGDQSWLLALWLIPILGLISTGLVLLTAAVWESQDLA